MVVAVGRRVHNLPTLLNVGKRHLGGENCLNLLPKHLRDQTCLGEVCHRTQLPRGHHDVKPVSRRSQTVVA
jgi:hypothetical protein